MVGFDNYEGGLEYRPVWVLHADGFSDFVVVGKTAVGQHFAINSDGVANWSYLPEGYLCFEELLLPPAGPLSLTMKRVSDGSEWKVEVNDDDVISDAQLKELGYQ